MDTNNKKLTEEQINATDRYPGAAFDIADDEKVDAKKVKADVKELNNNPRNNDLDQ